MISRIRTTFLLAIAVFAAAPASHAQKLSADDVLLRNFVLTMPKVEAWASATLDYAAALKAKPMSGHQKDATEAEAKAAETITGTAAALDRIPEIRRAFRKVGLTTREGMLIAVVLFQASAFNEVAAMSPKAEVPYNMNPANLAFVRKNKTQLDARIKAVQEATKDASAEATSDDEPSPDEP